MGCRVEDVKPIVPVRAGGEGSPSGRDQTRLTGLDVMRGEERGAWTGGGRFERRRRRRRSKGGGATGGDRCRHPVSSLRCPDR